MMAQHALKMSHCSTGGGASHCTSGETLYRKVGFQAGTFDNALKSVNEVMGGTMIDYVTAKIEETKIMDVYEYVSKDESETTKSK